MLTRAIILEKLTGYLNQRLSKQAIYEWALFVAVSHEFEKIAAEDLLIGKTIQALIDINHDDLKNIPTHKMLEYYRRCLAGELTFEPLEYMRNLERMDLSKEQFAADEEKKVEKRHEERKQIRLMVRIYVVLFAFCSLVIHLFSILQPNFLRFAETIPTRLENLWDSLPHVLYAIIILLPMRLTARGNFFYITFFVSLWGLFLYWYLPFIIVSKLAINMIFILALLPFSAIPASLAVWLLIKTRKERPSN